MKGILYKYRDLNNFKNFVDILLKNRLFAAQYKDLNDPMEGQYYYETGKLARNIRTRLAEEKEILRLCSLSRINNNELMWSHYADGQRGVAIGLKIDDTKYNVKPIIYDGLFFNRNQNFFNETAIEILSHKLVDWNYEQEERVFVRTTHFVDIKIEEIITGRSMSNDNYDFIRELIQKINPTIKIIKAKTIMD